MQQRGIQDSHPSIAISMDDFEARDFSPSMSNAALQQSARYSHASENSPISESTRSISPPAWRKSGSGWFNHQPSISPSRTAQSKEPSPDYLSADEEEEEEVGSRRRSRVAARIPLPESPLNGRSPSPTPDPALARAEDLVNPFKTTPPRLSPEQDDAPAQTNYMRFSANLDVLFRTEAIESAINWLRSSFRYLTKNRTGMILSIMAAISIAYLANFVIPQVAQETPDLVKIAKIAESFQPAIYYSEHGVAQIAELHDTGIAVWDLGESVRSSNMTGAPVIYEQLDGLSDSIKELAMQLTSFFTAVDKDVDAILETMEWAELELRLVSEAPSSTMATIGTNVQGLLLRVPMIGNNALTKHILGRTNAEVMQAALERTFREFLNVMEDSINQEISTSLKLFRLFESIDGQFQNLRRSTAREEDTQERLQYDFLSSLWTKMVGFKASTLRKFEKNRDLLASVRDRTLQNKHTLDEHTQRLRWLKSNLEELRRRLVSPLVQANSTQSVGEQIRGLQATYRTLKDIRDEQKRKVLEAAFGPRKGSVGTRSIEAGYNE